MPGANGHHALRKKAAMISFLVGILMLIMKMGGYLITNSAAVLSDAMESVVHVMATGMALYSILLSSKPADKTHPYGYGKIEYFSAGIEGSLIIVAAIAICYEAIGDIVSGNVLRSITVGVWIVAAAGAINLLLGFYLIRTGKTTNSITLVADGMHVLTDSYTSIGVLIGLLLVQFTGITLLDPVFAIAVALNILITGYKLIRESFRGLMNFADQDTLQHIVDTVQRKRTHDMIEMHRLRAWSAGSRKHIDFHMTLPYYLPLQSAHDIHDILEFAIIDEFQGEADVLVHLDPCNFSCCVFCPKPDCPVRQHEQEKDIVFSVRSASAKPIYSDGEKEIEGQEEL